VKQYVTSWLQPHNTNNFAVFRKHLASKGFAADGNVKQHATSWLQPHNTNNFAVFRKYLAGKGFAADGNAEQYVTSWLQPHNTNNFNIRAQAVLSYGVLKVYMSAVTRWASGVYHLLPTSHVYVDIRIKLPTSVCSGILLKLSCTFSCVVKGMNRISWFKFEIWKLIKIRWELISDLSSKHREKD
jgi:hypothetical protein